MIAWFRQLIFQDFWLKLFSLVLAILIWVTVSLAIQKEVSPVASLTASTAQHTFFNLPVLVVSSAEDVRKFRVSPREVEVTVEGDSKILQSLQSKDVRVLVDVSGIEAANSRARIQVSTPAGVTHVRVVPQEAEVLFQTKE